MYNEFNSMPFDHDGTRTHNLPIRSRTPYPLGHAATSNLSQTGSMKTVTNDRATHEEFELISIRKPS